MNKVPAKHLNWPKRPKTNKMTKKKKKKKTQTAKMNSTPLTTIFKTTKTLFNLQNGKKKS